MRFPDTNISMQQIKMFLVVADTENITQAASILHVSQSTLSKNIAAIEKELDLILFIRQKGRLTLSPPGRVLRDELTDIRSHFDDAIDKAYMEQAQTDIPVMIGILDNQDPLKYMMPSIRNFSSLHSEFRYHIESFPIQDLMKRLLNRGIDIAFTPLFDEPFLKHNGVEYSVLRSFPYTAYMKRENPLAQKRAIKPEDVATQNVITYYPEIAPHYNENVILHLEHELGHQLMNVKFVSSYGGLVMNVKNDNDIFITDYSRMKVDPFWQLKRVPIDFEYSGALLAWNKTDDSAINSFIEATVQLWD